MKDPCYNQSEIETRVLMDSVSRNLKAAGLGLVKLSEMLKSPPQKEAQAKRPSPPEGS